MKNTPGKTIRLASQPCATDTFGFAATRCVLTFAAKLGNTPTICKKCYVHPFVLDAYMDGTLLAQAAEQRVRLTRHGLNTEEAMVLGLLKRRLKAQAQHEKGGLLKQLQASVKH